MRNCMELPGIEPRLLALAARALTTELDTRLTPALPYSIPSDYTAQVAEQSGAAATIIRV